MDAPNDAARLTTTFSSSLRYWPLSSSAFSLSLLYIAAAQLGVVGGRGLTHQPRNEGVSKNHVSCCGGYESERLERLEDESAKGQVVGSLVGRHEQTGDVAPTQNTPVLGVSQTIV